MNEKIQLRRDFLKVCGQGLVGVAIIGFVAPIINSCSSPTDPGANVAEFNITVDVSSMALDNTAIRTQTPDGYGLLVVRHTSTSYGTLLLVCTHESCSNGIVQASAVLTCNCHGSEFDLSGGVTKGPASTNLKTYSTTLDAVNKKVTIHS